MPVLSQMFGCLDLPSVAFLLLFNPILTSCRGMEQYLSLSSQKRCGCQHQLADTPAFSQGPDDLPDGPGPYGSPVTQVASRQIKFLAYMWRSPAQRCHTRHSLWDICLVAPWFPQMCSIQQWLLSRLVSSASSTLAAHPAHQDPLVVLQGDMWGGYTAVGVGERGDLCAPETDGANRSFPLHLFPAPTVPKLSFVFCQSTPLPCCHVQRHCSQSFTHIICM